MIGTKRTLPNMWLVIILVFVVGFATVNFLRIDVNAYGCLIAALFTIFLFRVAKVQLGAMTKTASADFIHKLKNDFFTPDVRRLMCLIENDCLCFVDDSGEGYFKVEKDKAKKLNLPKTLEDELIGKEAYLAYEMDDFLLGHFEDIGIFEQQGVLDIEMVYEEFSWYLTTAWNNCAVSKYIRKSREEDGDDIYDKFEYIKNKCDAFGDAKENKKTKG